MVRAQLIALLYWPVPEFMKRVFTTSTGEATTVVQKPAPKAAVKWHGMLSAQEQKQNWILAQYFLFCHMNLVVYEIEVQNLPVIRSYFRMSSLIMS